MYHDNHLLSISSLLIFTKYQQYLNVLSRVYCIKNNPSELRNDLYRDFEVEGE